MKIEINLSNKQISDLEDLLHRTSREVIHTRAQIIVAKGQGMSTLEIAGSIGVSAKTVRKWSKLYKQQGIEGLYTTVGRIKR